MDINLYLLKFCGMFDFSPNQREKLTSNSFVQRKQILRVNEPHAWNYIYDQYYPSFRRFITNENSEIDNFTILSALPELIKGSYEKQLIVNGREVTIGFHFKEVEIFLFKDSPGIIALDIVLNEAPLSLEVFSAFVNGTRNYNSQVFDVDGLQYITMLELIEINVLNRASGADTFNLSEARIADYRGSKLKVFQGIDFKEKPGRDLKKILFELGTVSPIESADGSDDYNAHSPSYYEQLISNAVSVYNNWTALCLFDTFTVVGHNYFKEGSTLKTWNENYFRIYVYGLYFKYYLFSVNGDGFHQNKRLRKQRREFYDFMRIYDADPISYNFLPNLINANIKSGLQTHTETEALRLRIERISGLINEDYNRLSSLILFIISIIALIPSNWNDMVTKTENNEGISTTINSPNLITFITKVLIVLGIWIINLTLGGNLKRFYQRIFN